jgi:hypothetical protein
MFEKYSNAKFHQNPFRGSRFVRAGGRTDGRTDIHDVTNSRFSQFYEKRLNT